jgi:hypothetical protein
MPFITVLVMVTKTRIRDNLKFEERTNAITPDKLDRSMRGKIVGRNNRPYPLTEEEATPLVPESEKTVEIV